MMIGYATPTSGWPASDLLIHQITLSKLFAFQILNGLPCKGFPFVTDTSGYLYCTVVSDDLCKMKENLRVNM
jgi:hypothetical protein